MAQQEEIQLWQTVTPVEFTPRISEKTEAQALLISTRQGPGYEIAGKTGTAQVFSLGQDEEYDAEKLDRKLHDHAVFVAFTPADAPRIALSVIVENGGDLYVMDWNRTGRISKLVRALALKTRR